MSRRAAIAWAVALGAALTAAAQPPTTKRLPPVQHPPPIQHRPPGLAPDALWVPRPVPPPRPVPYYPLPILFLLPLWLIVIYQAEKQQERIREEQRAEEEDKTTYTEGDLMDDWEFKIVRCTHPAFVKREFLATFLEQEAVAGWQLVEVFDAHRVRLKRPTARRAGDTTLPPGSDPYRLYVVDPAAAARTVARVLWVVCALCAVAALTVGSVAAVQDASVGLVVAGVFAAAALVFGALAWRRGRT